MRGDLDLDPRYVGDGRRPPRVLLAVLVGIVDRPIPTVLLTQRTSALSNHAGQIAFPGGKIDPDDATPLAAAVARGARRGRAFSAMSLSRSAISIFT